MDAIFIQAQDTAGVWRSYSVTVNDPVVILVSMRSLKTRFPHYRIRAIDFHGKLVDMLP